MVERFRDELQAGRVRGFLERLTATSHGFAMADLPVSVLRATPEALEAGISLGDINRTLREVHPRAGDLNPGNVTHRRANSAASLHASTSTTSTGSNAPTLTTVDSGPPESAAQRSADTARLHREGFVAVLTESSTGDPYGKTGSRG